MSSAAVEMLPSSYSARLSSSRPKPRACRNLFGKPDKGEIDRFLASEMQRIRAQESNRYNFDFDNETPLDSVDGKYEWSTSNVKDMPSIYRPITVCAQGKRLPMRTTSRLACLAAEPTHFVSLEHQPTCSANESSSSSALPSGLQVRLQGLSSNSTQPQSAAVKRTDINVEDLFSTPPTCSTKPTNKGNSSCRQRRSAPPATSNQSKITDYLQARKRPAEQLHQNPKRRRPAEVNISASTPPTTSQSS